MDPKAREVLAGPDETQVEERLRQAYSKIAAAKLATGGDDVYPDATFSLRLSFGLVASFEEGAGKFPPSRTTAACTALESQQPQRTVRPSAAVDRCREELKLDTPYNFAAKLDHIGGNSGSPILDREGRIVGLLFDSNIYGLALDVGYTDTQCRAISVDTRAVVEALKSVYGAQALVDEMTK